MFDEPLLFRPILSWMAYQLIKYLQKCVYKSEIEKQNVDNVINSKTGYILYGIIKKTFIVVSLMINNNAIT